jgi:hypothetical protein
MDQQPVQQQPVHQQSVPTKQIQSHFDTPPPRSAGNKLFLVVFALFILAFVGAAGYLFGYQQGSFKNGQQAMASKKIRAKVASSSAYAAEVTKETKIAKSLAVPKLDPKLTWIDVTKTASDEGLMKVEGALLSDKYNFIPIPFSKGSTYIATGAATVNPDLFAEDKYYETNLLKLGWVVTGTGGNNDYLTFKTFRLKGTQADGVCGGIIGYLGYKDGMVRYIAINRSLHPCIPPGTKTAVGKETVDFTVFVSDPTPVSYFVDYLKKYPQVMVSQIPTASPAGEKSNR